MTKSKFSATNAVREESPRGIEPDIESVAGLPQLLRAFREATGWSLEYHRGSKPTHPTGLTWSAPVNPGVGATPGHVQLGPVRPASSASEPPGIPEGVQGLAAAVADLLGQLLRTRRALWQREAELAAGVPVVVRPDEAKHLAARLQAVLRGGAEAVGCHAAALYLLDEATTHLKLRSSWGLPPERLTDPPRSLEGALADLEAMLGHAVVLEDTDLLPDWSAPEEFPCAACVPVATATTILGTLWVFCQTRRDFNDRETNILEVVAGRLAADLEREMLLHESVKGAYVQREMAAVEHVQRRQLPAIAPLLDGWDVAGWVPHCGAPHGDFFDWFSTPQGLTAMVLGAVAAAGMEGALSAGALRGAIRSHGQYQPTPDALLRQVGLTFWTGSAGDQAASLFCGLIDPREGVLRYAASGSPGVVLLQPEGWKSLTDPTPPLGLGPDSTYTEGGCRLEPGQAVLVFTLRSGTGNPIGQDELSQAEKLLADLALRRLDLAAKDLLVLASHALQARANDGSVRLGSAVVVKRRDA